MHYRINIDVLITVVFLHPQRLFADLLKINCAFNIALLVAPHRLILTMDLKGDSINR